MEDLISVIINVYNSERFIKKCIESIINQTYKNLEILIINDGSTDNTLKICQGFQDYRIRIINQENMGLSKARNVGIENARGEYLYFIDSDDFVENDVIEYLHSLCIKYDTTFSTCLSLMIYDYDFVVKNKKEKVIILDTYEMLKRVLLSKEDTVTTWNKLYKRELFNNIRFENRIINDKVVAHKLVIEAKRIAYSNQIKYYYLKHRNAITVKNDKDYDRAVDTYQVSEERYFYIKELYPHFIENDIGQVRAYLKLYLIDNEEFQKYLKEQNVIKKFYELFSFKFFFRDIGIKEKSKIFLFAINPILYRYVARKYRRAKYQCKL